MELVKKCSTRILSLIVTLSITLPHYCTAQFTSIKTSEVWNGDTVYSKVSIMPATKSDFTAWLTSAIHYPKKARKKRIEGRVVVRFIVDKEGFARNVSLAKSSGDESLDEEAIRVVKSMPAWWPGLQDGIPVPVTQDFPLTFRLE